MTSKSFTPVSPQRWQDIQKVFSQQSGVALTGDSGISQSHGIHFSWSYANESLTVSVVSVPWYIPMNEQDIMVKFASWINGV